MELTESTTDILMVHFAELVVSVMLENSRYSSSIIDIALNSNVQFSKRVPQFIIQISPGLFFGIMFSILIYNVSNNYNQDVLQYYY